MVHALGQVPEEYWQAEVHLPSLAPHLWARSSPHLQASAAFLGCRSTAHIHSGPTRPTLSALVMDVHHTCDCDGR